MRGTITLSTDCGGCSRRRPPRLRRPRRAQSRPPASRRVQFLALVALIGVEGHPLDVVLRQHGMLYGADLDMNDAVFHSPDRDVLLHGGVGGTGDDLAHRLTATDDGNARVLDLGNDVAANACKCKTSAP